MDAADAAATGEAGGRDEDQGSGPDAGGVVNYYFPVEMHAVGSLPDGEGERLADLVFQRLDTELASRL
ncbi:hypothetical protein [Actinomadura sp. NTSP31]|uniref:hypothetical protein n=1 Tax=Actinomadura sp. NTSP31 TaxID=1735447 RepID=UPI0035C01578